MLPNAVIVSTVGNYRPRSVENGAAKTIGVGRYYETMVFRAQLEKPYWEANVSKEISITSPWRIDHIEHETDAEADAMHEQVVREISTRLVQRKL